MQTIEQLIEFWELAQASPIGSSDAAKASFVDYAKRQADLLAWARDLPKLEPSHELKRFIEHFKKSASEPAQSAEE